MAELPPQRHLVLILARNFASRLATAVFLVDAEGRVIFFNEAAEELLATKFLEGHGMSAEEYTGLFRPTARGGRAPGAHRDPARDRRQPPGALARPADDHGRRRRPAAHRGDGRAAARARRRPGRRDRVLLGTRRGLSRAHPLLGQPRDDRLTRRRHGALRREHVLRGGPPGRRDAPDARRRDRRPRPRPRARRGAGPEDRPPDHAPPRRPRRGPRGVRADLAGGDGPARLGAAVAGRLARGRASRPTSRPRCSPSTSPRCRRWSRSTTRPRARGRSAARRSARPRSSTRGSPSATASRPTASRVAYLTDHEPALGTDLGTAAPEWVSGAALAWEADVLIHDCQYTEEEYAARVGFGHSSTAARRGVREHDRRPAPRPVPPRPDALGRRGRGDARARALAVGRGSLARRDRGRGRRDRGVAARRSVGRARTRPTTQPRMPSSRTSVPTGSDRSKPRRRPSRW